MKRLLNALVWIGMLVVLTGCIGFGGEGKVRPQLPPAPERLTDPNYCGTGAAVAGEDARISARRKEIARKCEHGINRSWNGFYGGLRSGLAGGS